MTVIDNLAWPPSALAAIEDQRIEIGRLRASLFQIQCEQLDRATQMEKSTVWHRKQAMATRDRIITILNV